ncbi:MAG: MaoC family dehydratase [Bryobacteraceae bacterium]
MREVATIQELKTLEGQEVAVGDWFEITQERVNQFADATEDHQWIHIDVEKCKAESPFGTTIAHGFLTLSLLPALTQRTFRISQKFAMSINYGLNKVRFMNPVRVGSRIRPRMTLIEVAEIAGGWQNRWQVTIEIEGQDKPACVAETIGRVYESAPK